MYKIIIIFGFLFLGVIFVSGTVHAADKTATPSVATSTSATTTLETPAEIEVIVRRFFADAPVMIEVAKCESKFRQFTDGGNVLRGGGSAGMIGIFQFYEVIHKSAALALGFDIETVEGNIGYAKYMYEREGTKPWASCVPAVMPVTTTPVMSVANKELQIKLLTKVVELLTELLKMELGKQ